MKRILLILSTILVCSAVCLAIKVTLFSDTDLYIKRAKDIVIAKCLSTPERAGMGTLNEVDISMVLKGNKKLGKHKVFTLDALEADKLYLLMSLGGYAGGTDLLAKDELSIVLIPSFLNLDILKDKNLKDQLHHIFASRLYVVEKKLEPLLNEKALLDRALLDRTDNLYAPAKPIHIDKISKAFAEEYQIGGEVTYLNLNSRQMEWSRGGEKTGYIYPYDPEKRRIVWEFAYINSSTFEELEGKELAVRFGGTHIPPGGSTIVVREGQMVLARHIDEPSMVYILKFDRQDDKKVFVRYAVIEEKQEPSSLNSR